MREPDLGEATRVDDAQLLRKARVLGGLSSIRSTVTLILEDAEVLLAEEVLTPTEYASVLRLCSSILDSSRNNGEATSSVSLQFVAKKLRESLDLDAVRQ